MTVDSAFETVIFRAEGRVVLTEGEPYPGPGDSVYIEGTDLAGPLAAYATGDKLGIFAGKLELQGRYRITVERIE